MAGAEAPDGAEVLHESVLRLTARGSRGQVAVESETLPALTWPLRERERFEARPTRPPGWAGSLFFRTSFPGFRFRWSLHPGLVKPTRPPSGAGSGSCFRGRYAYVILRNEAPRATPDLMTVRVCPPGIGREVHRAPVLKNRVLFALTSVLLRNEAKGF